VVEAKAEFIIDEFFEHNGYDFPERSEELKREVIKLKESLEILYPKLLLEDNDTRSGEEVYGIKNNDHWNTTLSSISDRWYCSIRVRWMLDLAKYFELDLEDNNE